VAAILLALRFLGLPASLLRIVGLGWGWSVVSGAAAVFIPVVAVVAYIGWRASKLTRQPGINLTNRLLGAALGVLSAGIALSFVLGLTPLLPLGNVAEVVRAPAARAIMAASAPLARSLEAVAGDDAVRISLYARQTLHFMNASDLSRLDDLQVPRERHVVADRGAERAMFAAATAERERRRLQPLRPDDALAERARAHARNMALEGYLGGEKDGPAEIVALAPSADLAQAAILRSRAQSDVLRDHAVNRIGVGAVRGRNGVYVVEILCAAC
jgi:hypothetical protein